MRRDIKIYLNNKKTKGGKSKMKKILLIPVLFLLITLSVMAATHARAQDFSMGEETKGLKVKVSDDTDISFRVRLQPRIDFGDLIKSEDGKSNESEMDMYIRRIRLEIGGQLYTNLKYSLVFEGDKNGKFASSGSPTNEVKIQLANIDYKFQDAFAVRFGKAKLPYSRVSLTSSSKQLIIERPVSTEAAKKLFDDYYQSHLIVHGKAAEGILAYNLAVGDGWEPNSTITGTTTVHKSDPLYIARLELSPPGWTEKDKSDAHLGKDRHLVLGVNYAGQKGIEYKTSAFGEDRTLIGADISGHYEGFTAQFEYNTWKEKYTNPATKEKKPKGWYAQTGYFISGLNTEPVARYEVYDQDSNLSDKTE
ncbi:MAG: porin, partial [Patescibacteria group bacterium]